MTYTPDNLASMTTEKLSEVYDRLTREASEQLAALNALQAERETVRRELHRRMRRTA
jgi:hypothetical protein